MDTALLVEQQIARLVGAAVDIVDTDIAVTTRIRRLASRLPLAVVEDEAAAVGPVV